MSRAPFGVTRRNISRSGFQPHACHKLVSAGLATHASGERIAQVCWRFGVAEQLAKAQDWQYYSFAGWMKAHGLTSESLGTSMSMR
jgi:hypothetical protein